MITKHSTHTIGAHYLPVLFNNDASGVTDDDMNRLLRYCAELPQGQFMFDGDVPAYDDFTTCDVTGLDGECVKLVYYTRARIRA